MSNGAPQPSEKRQREASSLDAKCPPPPDLTRKLLQIKDRFVAGGAFGDVYRCRYNGSSKPQEVAVKALRFSFEEDKTHNMLRRELGIWKRLSHANIVPFLGIAYGFGMCNAISLVSLWMPNESLYKFLETHNGELEMMHRLQILLDVAKGLDYLHSLPIVHGDLYPNNILLDADYTARLTDFGFSSLVGNSPDALAYLQLSTARPGALRWVAPELLDPEETFHLSTECDIYSFGCIALQVLSGKQPWSEVRADMAVITLLAKRQNPGRPESLKTDDSLWDFIQHCWSSPQDRPAANNLKTSLEQFIKDYPLSGPLRNLFISPTSDADSTVLTPLSVRYRITSAVSESVKTYRGFQADPNDFIIIFMGPTGSGKSNFINHLTGQAETGNARNLKSDTQKVAPHIIHRDGLRIVLVDTPGFDDTYRSDAEILRVIANWLTQRYPGGETLRAAGIAYLHRITDKRISGSVYKNLQMFGRLCGDVPLHRTRIVTTMWDTARDQRAAQQKEKELTDEFWNELVNEGAEVKRFNNTPASAQVIIDELLALGPDGDKFLLQEEMVGQGKRLNETEAGKVLYSRFQKLLEDQRKTLKELADEARSQNDPALAKDLQEEYEKINEQLQKTFEEMKEMKIPFLRWFTLLFKGKSRGKALKFDSQ